MKSLQLLYSYRCRKAAYLLEKLNFLRLFSRHYLQAYMGHDRLDETVYYVHLLPENLVQSAGIDWNAFDGLIPEVLP